jgi:hypothetical protein
MIDGEVFCLTCSISGDGGCAGGCRGEEPAAPMAEPAAGGAAATLDPAGPGMRGWEGSQAESPALTHTPSTGLRCRRTARGAGEDGADAGSLACGSGSGEAASGAAMGGSLEFAGAPTGPSRLPPTTGGGGGWKKSSGIATAPTPSRPFRPAC